MLTALVIGAVACGTPAKLPVSAGTGVKPVLPPQENALIPIVNVVTAKGWPPEATPTAADGLTVRAFARPGYSLIPSIRPRPMSASS